MLRARKLNVFPSSISIFISFPIEINAKISSTPRDLEWGGVTPKLMFQCFLKSYVNWYTSKPNAENTHNQIHFWSKISEICLLKRNIHYVERYTDNKYIDIIYTQRSHATRDVNFNSSVHVLPKVWLPTGRQTALLLDPASFYQQLKILFV